ncbi:MAG: hypothetical protein FH761_15325 [Firmicutes bacterium]|nr:hypothetical protein [Bacillota bacterium]
MNNSVTLGLQNKIVKTKDRISNFYKKIQEQKGYLDKLLILRNQYTNEIERLEYMIEGYYKLSKIDFERCPSCLKVIKSEKDKCSLCGNEDIQLETEEILAFKYEKRKLKMKLTKLLSYIEEEEKNLFDIEKANEKTIEALTEYEEELHHLQKGYVNPIIEQVEQLNYEIGALNKEIYNLKKTIGLLIS